MPPNLNDSAYKPELLAPNPAHTHKWSAWKEVGRTGDWFHPLIVERKCEACGVTETEDH